MAKKVVRQKPPEVLEDEDEALSRRVSVLLEMQLTLSEWAEFLEKNDGEVNDLMKEWMLLSYELSATRAAWNEEPLPGCERGDRYIQIADLLVSWMEEKANIDPTPVLAAVRCRLKFGEWRKPTPIAKYISKDVWDRWEQAVRDSEVVIDRAIMRLRRKSGKGPRKGPELSTEAKILGAIETIRKAGEVKGLDQNQIAKSLTAKAIAAFAVVGETTVKDSKIWQSLRAGYKDNGRALRRRISGETDDDE